MLLLAAVLVMAASCKKEDPAPGPDTPETTRKDEISKTWKVTAILINNAPADGVDFSSYSFEFKKSGSYDITAGSLTGTGKWELNSNEEKLILDKGTSSQKTADILSLTSSKLELEFTEASGKTGEQKVLFKLKQ